MRRAHKYEMKKKGAEADAAVDQANAAAEKARKAEEKAKRAEEELDNTDNWGTAITEYYLKYLSDLQVTDPRTMVKRFY